MIIHTYQSFQVKMDHREYKSSSEFAEDMRLIYKNCYLYNPPDHPVVDMAKDFEQIFEKKFTEIPDTSESSEEDSGNERSEKVKFILQQVLQINNSLQTNSTFPTVLIIAFFIDFR